MSFARCWSLLAASVLLIAPTAFAQRNHEPPEAVAEIRTSGTATVTIPADLAIISIQFTARGATPLAAGRMAAERANAIRQALVAIGIPRDSMPTGGRWGWWGSRSQMNVGPYSRDTTYITNDVFTVRIRNLKLIGPAIDTALAEGAQTISNIEFTATDTRKADLEALKQATVSAREHAEAIAAASGGRLGRMIELTTESPARSYDYGDPYRLRLRGSAATASGEATTVVNPQMQITMTVYGRWTYR